MGYWCYINWWVIDDECYIDRWVIVDGWYIDWSGRIFRNLSKTDKLPNKFENDVFLWIDLVVTSGEYRNVIRCVLPKMNIAQYYFVLHYCKLLSELRECFPSNELKRRAPPRYSWNIVERGIKHLKLNPQKTHSFMIFIKQIAITWREQATFL